MQCPWNGLRCLGQFFLFCSTMVSQEVFFCSLCLLWFSRSFLVTPELQVPMLIQVMHFACHDQNQMHNCHYPSLEVAFLIKCINHRRIIGNKVRMIYWCTRCIITFLGLVSGGGRSIRIKRLFESIFSWSCLQTVVWEWRRKQSLWGNLWESADDAAGDDHAWPCCREIRLQSNRKTMSLKSKMMSLTKKVQQRMSKKEVMDMTIKKFKWA